MGICSRSIFVVVGLAETFLPSTAMGLYSNGRANLIQESWRLRSEAAMH